MAKKTSPRHTYVIGDLQGCHDELHRLLDRIEFDDAQDHLWLVGDLVSRGPKSLEILRYLKSLGDAVVCVLGNHDLHLLAAAAGVKQRALDPTLEPVMQANDRDELIHWLRHRPLIHREKRPNWPHEWLMVHAGLAPQWNIGQAEQCAREVEAVLRSDEHGEYFKQMYGNSPSLWSDDLQGWQRLRFITNCMTRMRFCSPEGELLLNEKGAPGTESPGAQPWFMVPGRKNIDAGILFGHWSTLGQVVWSTGRVYGLDGGCVWGGKLIALRLEDMDLTFLPCEGYQKPG